MFGLIASATINAFVFTIYGNVLMKIRASLFAIALLAAPTTVSAACDMGRAQTDMDFVWNDPEAKKCLFFEMQNKNKPAETAFPACNKGLDRINFAWCIRSGEACTYMAKWKVAPCR